MRDPKSTLLIDARDISVSFAGHKVLDSVALRVARGEIVTLIGLNGGGKSTLVRIILGLLQPDSGQLTCAPGMTVGYSPQHIHRDHTLPMTVARFLTLGAHASRRRLRTLLTEVGAGEVLDAAISDISGGELHRVMLARALLREPDLLVLDEPMAGVDISGQSDLYRLIADLRERYGCGVLLVSHDLHLVMAATDTVVCLNHHVCCTGHPHAVATDPRFARLFGRSVAESLAVYTHHHDHGHDVTGVPVTLAKPETLVGDPGCSG